MKRNECGTEEDLLPYYALFGLPRKLRTLEKTLESIPKAGRRIPGWATFVMPGSCSPKSPGHRKRSDLSYPSSSRSTGRMGRTTPQSWRTGSTSRHRTSHTALNRRPSCLSLFKKTCTQSNHFCSRRKVNWCLRKIREL